MRIKIFACLVGLCAVALAAPVEEPRVFSPELTELLTAYKGTEQPFLPATEKRGDIERELSVVPGRMHIPRSITVNKERCRVYLLNIFGDTLQTYGVCSSRNRGQKRFADDCRTPEGTFKLHGVYNSTDWTYKDTGSKCYGPFFLHVKTPRFYGIGLHGTNAPGSVPGRSSHGCMRLLNENIVKLKGLVNKDILVTILPDKTTTGELEAPKESKAKPSREAESENKESSDDTSTSSAEGSPTDDI